MIASPPNWEPREWQRAPAVGPAPRRVCTCCVRYATLYYTLDERME